MDTAKSERRLKSESSEEEDDFESADEGEESQQSSRPPSLEATSAVDGRNSTLKSQISKDSTSEIPSKMAELEDCSTLTSHKSEEIGKSDGDSSRTIESFNTADIDRGAVESSSANLEGKSSDSDPHDVRSEDEEEEKKFSGDDSVLKDVSEDEEVQFNIDSITRNDGDTSELEKTQTEDETIPTKTIDNQDDNGEVVNVIQEQNMSSGAKKEDAEKEKTSKSDDLSQTNVGDSENVYNDSPAEKSTEPPAESANHETQERDRASQSDGWGWGSWGTMLSQATASVSSGLSSVIETVETSLGIPEPEEIAKKVAEDEKEAEYRKAENKKAEKVIETEPTSTDPPPKNASQESGEGARGEVEESSFFSGFGVRGLSEVVSEGLGALEYIGKKTMDVISEGDPGLRNKREALLAKEPTLSQILREAKEKAEYKAFHPEHNESIVNFSTEFDKYQGLAHLEALEILSKESLSKVEARIIDLSSEDLKCIKPLLRTIQEVVRFSQDEEENDDDEEQDFESEVLECLKDLNLTHIPNKTDGAHKRAKEWVDACINEQNENPVCKDHTEIFTAGISALAELTACTVEQFHKIAEVLLLLAENTDTSALVRAQSLKKLTLCVCKEVSNLSSRFASCLSTVSKESEDPETVESLITTLYLESSDSSRYLQHALKLLCPVLQQSSLSENTSVEKS